jgi:murein DD-endopeptidase MepM/ murein hydrolase activator NlpD
MGAAVAILAVLPLVLVAPAGAQSLGRLEARMKRIQEQLDHTTRRLEKLRTRAEEARRRIAVIEERSAELQARTERLEREAGERADALYREGGTEMLEVLLVSEDFAELADRAEMLSAVSLDQAAVFVELSRSKLELERLARALADKHRDLRATSRDVAAESRRLQDQFDAASADYKELKERLARQRRTATTSGARAPAGVLAAPATGGMTCPVAGPVSFVDSWGAPRDGHTHQGVDMMAGYGTPIVAIVSGTITYAAYDGSGGNMIFLAGDDGNAYWYMHNQANLVSGGHVSVGEQIAAVGDTGNAEGTPHLHFEYHPGGGAAVDPYPLVASIC